MKFLFVMFLIFLWVHGIYEGNSTVAVGITLLSVGALLVSHDEKRTRKKVRR